MSFLNLNIKREYRSFRDNIVEEFYVPILNESILYRRAVGFFSSTSLAQIAKGVQGLIDNGGKIQLIASPKLSDNDVEAINLGYKLRKDAIEKKLIEELREPKDYFESENLNILANLIAKEQLDIRIAILNKNNQLGIYHEKLGLVTDQNNDMIAFTGSLNETANAMLVNYESIDVFTSWSDFERVKDKDNAFNNIWTNNIKGLDVLEFPSIKQEIIKKYKSDSVGINKYKYKVSKNNNPFVPDKIKLYDYQLEAINNWKENDYCGIFDMATGTGKTITGISALVNLYNHLNGKLAVIIICPYTHLVEQWLEDLKLFNINPIIAYSESEDKNYKRKIKDAVLNYNLGVISYFCMITTNATYRTEFIQSKIVKLKKDTLIIVDEAHNFGSANLQDKLLNNFKYRLALSATLDRHNDEIGTSALYNYFGEKCIEYTLGRAIKEKKLTPYYYYPIPVYLSRDELERYKVLSREIGKNIIKTASGRTKLTEHGKMLTLKRARLVAGAKNKVKVLKSKIEKYKNDSYIVVYCGATTVTEDYCTCHEEDLEGKRQIDLITELLGNELNMRVAQFTSKEDTEERTIIKEKFSYGREIQALIAIKCLDEGVNIPQIKTAFILASTTNPKEYIQRRGRVLRLVQGKEYAEIFDFITLPRELENVKGYANEEVSMDKSLLINEVKRLIEFRDLSLNPYESDKLISEIQNAYDLNLYSLKEENLE